MSQVDSVPLYELRPDPIALPTYFSARAKYSFPVRANYEGMSDRLLVEIVLGQRVIVTRKSHEDGVTFNVWVPSWYMDEVQAKVEERARTNPTWHHEGWNLKVAERYWDVDTRPATALNYWDQLGLL